MFRKKIQKKVQDYFLYSLFVHLRKVVDYDCHNHDDAALEINDCTMLYYT